MKFFLLACTLMFLFSPGQSSAQDTVQDTLPDNHLRFTLQMLGHRLEGASEYLEGFKVSMDIPSKILAKGLDSEGLMSILRAREITGILTYPNGRSTRIEYEVVNHRGRDDIYMKTTLGYFLWESFDIQDDRLTFVINWWYCPPAREVDLQTLEMAERLLADSANWHKHDDRKCDDDIENNEWSLFCAQTVRFVIDDLVPNHDFDHPLMDFNNAPTTKHSDILQVLAVAKKKIEHDLGHAEK
jgi:hypothetical protein